MQERREELEEAARAWLVDFDERRRRGEDAGMSYIIAVQDQLVLREYGKCGASVGCQYIRQVPTVPEIKRPWSH